MQVNQYLRSANQKSVFLSMLIMNCGASEKTFRGSIPELPLVEYDETQHVQLRWKRVQLRVSLNRDRLHTRNDWLLGDWWSSSGSKPTGRLISMKEGKLGKLDRVDLRTVWEREGSDFTPWLEKNVRHLEEALGVEIDIEGREVQIGKFTADLVGKEPNSDRVVVIENQLDDADHDHLGKTLVYAAGRGASTVVWISKHFRDEYRQTLEWLNEISGKDIRFFGVELEMLTIDDSKPAPYFKPVVIPSEWQKTAAESELTERQRMYHEFFTEYLNRVKSRYKGWTAAQSGGYENWYSLRSGVSSSYYYEMVFKRGKKIRVGLYIDTGNKEENKQCFDYLQEHRQEIEKQLGSKLEWERMDHARASCVGIYRPGTIKKKEDWEQNLSWGVDYVGRFRKTFTPHLEEWEKE